MQKKMETFISDYNNKSFGDNDFSENQKKVIKKLDSKLFDNSMYKIAPYLMFMAVIAFLLLPTAPYFAIPFFGAALTLGVPMWLFIIYKSARKVVKTTGRGIRSVFSYLSPTKTTK